MPDKQYRDPEELRREVGIDAPLDKVSKVEIIKRTQNGLRGNIYEETADPDLPAVSHDSYQIMKHFGMYQQDDRDVRRERRKEGKEKDYSFMVRTKVPGGRLTPEQYLMLDDAATKFAKSGLRVTTRQTIQFHGVGKDRLFELARMINEKLLTTYGACGDVVRNTVSCPVIDLDPRPEWAGRENFVELSRQISDRTLPRTQAYYDIFINGERAKGMAPTFELRSEAEDIYGPAYMPRKFKVGLCVPEDNCVDVFTQDLGIVAIVEDGKSIGYNLMVGGGLGFQFSKKETYARAATPVAFVTADHIMKAVDAVITIQRDYGDRVDRKQARLKYLVDRVGLDWFHEEMERRMGMELEPAREIPEDQWQYHDHLGWHEQKQPGLLYVGIFIENGRIIDRPGNPVRSNLRKIVERFRPEVRLTPQQNMVLANIPEKHREEIDTILKESGLAVGVNGMLTELRRHEMACVALPSCGLALAESERSMPDLMTQLEEKGLGGERISIRMSGCPNSCSRSPASEIGIIGCAPGKYHLYIGGDYEGTRMNKLYKERILFDDLAEEIACLIRRWKDEKKEGEAFGDWSHRLVNEELLEV